MSGKTHLSRLCQRCPGQHTLPGYTMDVRQNTFYQRIPWMSGKTHLSRVYHGCPAKHTLPGYTKDVRHNTRLYHLRPGDPKILNQSQSRHYPFLDRNHWCNFRLRRRAQIYKTLTTVVLKESRPVASLCKLVQIPLFQEMGHRRQAV